MGTRLCQISLESLASWELEQISAAMQVPFPELTDLSLFSDDETPLFKIPDSFLGGSAPRLEYVRLYGIPFPGLPKPFLSASHLTSLLLHDIPHSGYFSPEAIVDLLSVLSGLRGLSLEFRSAQSRPDPDSRRPPPPQLSLIPALDYLRFQGATEYLEDLVTFIDTPRLFQMYITFFDQIDFYTPRLAQFINRTFKRERATPEASVIFDDDSVRLRFTYWVFVIEILCTEPDWQLSSIQQICNSSLRPISKLEDLTIEHRYHELVWEDDLIENTLWLQLLLPFTAVKSLYLSKEFSQGIAAALNELTGDRITEVLPSLQTIFVAGREQSGSFRESVGQFIAARQLSGHPVTVYS